MAVYNADKMTAGTQPKVLPTAAGVNVIAKIALTAALLLNDTINFMTLAADASDPNGQGPSILDFNFDSDQLDSNGVPTLAMNLGDATLATRYLTASTIVRGGGVVGPANAGTIGFQPFATAFAAYPTISLATYTIFATVSTAPATWKNGSLRLAVAFTYDP